MLSIVVAIASASATASSVSIKPVVHGTIGMKFAYDQKECRDGYMQKCDGYDQYKDSNWELYNFYDQYGGSGKFSANQYVMPEQYISPNWYSSSKDKCYPYEQCRFWGTTYYFDGYSNKCCDGYCDKCR